MQPSPQAAVTHAEVSMTSQRKRGWPEPSPPNGSPGRHVSRAGTN